jgi:thiol-disulfide isomerase/thioredoxin
MDRKTVLTIIELIPPVSAVLAFILIFTSAQAGWLTTAAVLLGFFGFVFFFIGRKTAKEDKTLKILGWLDLLSTVAIIALYVLAMAVFAGAISFGGDDEEDGGSYAVEEQAVGANIGTFESVDMDGNEVSDSIFADKDVTVINVWATFCGPCIEEMPELAAWTEELPDNVQIVGIVIDTPPAGADGDGGDWGGDPDNIELAKKICDETGVKYTNVLASGSVMETFEKVQAVPTTFIVDKSGNLICSPFVGADVEGYKKAVEDYLAGL